MSVNRGPCYWGAESCRNGHATGCPAYELYMTGKDREFFGGEKKFYPTDAPTEREEQAEKRIALPSHAVLDFPAPGPFTWDPHKYAMHLADIAAQTVIVRRWDMPDDV